MLVQDFPPLGTAPAVELLEISKQLSRGGGVTEESHFLAVSTMIYVLLPWL